MRYRIERSHAISCLRLAVTGCQSKTKQRSGRLTKADYRWTRYLPTPSPLVRDYAISIYLNWSIHLSDNAGATGIKNTGSI